MERYTLKVTVVRSQLPVILAKIDADIQPKVKRRFLRRPVLVWNHLARWQVHQLQEFFTQGYLALKGFDITPE